MAGWNDVQAVAAHLEALPIGDPQVRVEVDAVVARLGELVREGGSQQAPMWIRVPGMPENHVPVLTAARAVVEASRLGAARRDQAGRSPDAYAALVEPFAEALGALLDHTEPDEDPTPLPTWEEVAPDGMVEIEVPDPDECPVGVEGHTWTLNFVAGHFELEPREKCTGSCVEAVEYVDGELGPLTIEWVGHRDGGCHRGDWCDCDRGWHLSEIPARSPDPGVVHLTWQDERGRTGDLCPTNPGASDALVTASCGCQGGVVWECHKPCATHGPAALPVDGAA